MKTLKQQYEDYRADADNRVPGANSMTFAEWCEYTLNDTQRVIAWSHNQLDTLGVDQSTRAGVGLTLIGRLDRLAQQVTSRRDLLDRAYGSNEAFYRAFDLYPPQPRTAGRMVDEEAGELREGLCAGDDPLSVGSEIADVLYTLMGVAHACGFTVDDIAEFVETKCNINDQKRPENGWGLNAKKKVVKL